MDKVLFTVWAPTSRNYELIKPHADMLIKKQRDYAIGVGAKYLVLQPDPMEYNELQHYKIEQMEILAKQYSKVCYMDLDVIPHNPGDIFDIVNDDQISMLGIDADGLHENDDQYSVIYKYHHKQSLLYNATPIVYNTGIIVGGATAINKLNYSSAATEYRAISKSTGYIPNNETYISVLVQYLNINIVDMDPNIHHIFDHNAEMWDEHTWFIHCINKNFEFITNPGRNVIFSLYIDIPDKNLVATNSKSDVYNDQHKKTKFNEYRDRLIQCKESYAKSVGADWKFFGDREHYEIFKSSYFSTYHQISEYDIINFYKIWLMYYLSKQYDNVLYLDMDVVPIKTNNLFAAIDFNRGIAIHTNTEAALNDLHKVEVKGYRKLATKSIRSPLAKHLNTSALLMNIGGHDTYNEVFNTGIVGANREWLTKLAYFDDFHNDLVSMLDVVDGDHIFPDGYNHLFGFDNETLFSVKVITNQVKTQPLNETWHYFYDKKETNIPSETVLVHMINKRFEELL